MSCRAEVPCHQIVQSYVVLNYEISQSNVGLDNPYCSNNYKAPLPVLFLCKLLRKFHSPTLQCICLFQFPHYSRVWTSSPWVASSLIWSSAVPGAALMSSTVWRRPYCLHCPYKFIPSKTPSGPGCPPQNC